MVELEEVEEGRNINEMIIYNCKSCGSPISHEVENAFDAIFLWHEEARKKYNDGGYCPYCWTYPTKYDGAGEMNEI